MKFIASGIHLYLILFLGLVTIGLTTSTYVMWNKYQVAKTNYERLQIAYDRAEQNLQRTSDLLERERELRRETEDILSEIRKVPDDDYSLSLPDSISDLLRRYRERMQ